MDNKLKGKIKWFSKEKGYGFIFGEDKKDYFVHIKDVKGEDIPQEKDEVEFKVIKNKKGLKAIDVIIIKKNKENQRKKLAICQHCGKEMVPRVIFTQGVPRGSICPFCGKTYKVFKASEEDLTAMYIIMGLVLFFIFFVIMVGAFS